MVNYSSTSRTPANMNSRDNGASMRPPYPTHKSHSAHGHAVSRPFADSGPSSVPADSPLGSPNPPFASSSRPNSPKTSSHSDDTHTRYPIGSTTTLVTRESDRTAVNGTGGSATISSNHPSSPASPTPTGGHCAACEKPVSGQFVRALGTMYHLDCFRCQDCNVVVASKFFPIEGPDGRQHPLCERDYFGRLNLICAKCGSALRGSYITACNKKFHVEHFTCSVCPTLFGQQDSYYEHQGDVYCYFHYSTRFATKCVGCNTAILKQFVEINRNMKDECWHPECYMIHKFWNVKIASRPMSIQAQLNDPAVPEEPHYKEDESLYDATTLKEKQLRMEALVFKIWTNLSSFEESSAACISEMLRHVSNGMYLDGIRMAEKFILHVEVLFAAIDDLEVGFVRVGAKGMSHVREARMLCRKTVDLFTLLSKTQEAAPAPSPSDTNGPLTPTTKQRMGMTQELLALVTGLAHYLKILIRIALTGALKLDREFGDRDSLTRFLESLHALAVEGGEPGANRMKVKVRTGAGQMVTSDGEMGPIGGGSDAVVSYGYRSLAPESSGESPFSPKAIEAAAAGQSSNDGKGGSTPPSDLCAACKTTVEEDCVRLGTYQRWHSHCIKCGTCGKIAAVPVPPKPSKSSSTDNEGPGGAPSGGSGSGKMSTARRPPAKVNEFRFSIAGDTQVIPAGTRRGGKLIPLPNTTVLVNAIYCTSHSPHETWSGFEAVSRLEQYAFLLNVALRRLFLLLKKKGVMPLIPASPVYKSSSSDSASSPRHSRDSDIMKLKSVHLDRKISATARVPKRSTIVESPTGKIAQASDVRAQQTAYQPQQPQHIQAQYQQYQPPIRPPFQQQPSSSYVSSKSPMGATPGARGPPPPRPPPAPALNSPPAQVPASYMQQQQQAANSYTQQQLDQSSPSQGAPYSAPLMSPTTTQPPYGLPPSSSSSQGHGSYGQEGHAIRPPFARNNTQVYIVDDKPHDGLATIDEHSLLSRSYPGSGTLEQSTAPSSSSHTHLGLAYDDSQTGHNDQDEIITLGDIPQLLESEQAREQHRSLPRQAGKPLLAELTPLELCIVKHFAVLALQRSTHLKGEFELDEILELIEVKKSTFWNKWFNKGGDKNKVKKKGVFGVPLELLVEQGTDSMLGSSRAPLRVPIFIDDVISAMKQMDMSVEGIFRKNGNIRRLRELTESIDRDPSAVDLTQENPVQLAALLKKFLRDLPDPLMTFKLHKLWNAVVALPTEAERKRFLHILSVILPKGNRDTLEALFVFLKWVASFAHVDEETGSKMDLQNLATVICPSILYAKGREAAREDSFTAIPVVAELLEDQDYFYTVPDEFLPVLQDQEYFANALDMPTKEVLKKAENYLKVKQARGYPAPSNSGGMPMSNSAAFGDRNGNNPANGRGDGNDTKLIPQRSDPNLPRGRSPNLGPSENGGLRNPPPLRIPTHSRSRERQQQPLSAVEPPGQGRDRLPSHPGIPHQQYNQGPPSPRSQQRPSEQPWGGTSPRPTQAGRQPGSRPSSFIRTNGEFLPQPANGRQSPAMGRF